MRKKTFVLMFSLLLTFAGPSFGIDRETLWTKLNFASSMAEIKAMGQIAKQNLGLVEEILFFSDMQRHNGPARDNALQIFKEGGESGLITKEHFFSTVLRLFTQINSIAHPSRVTSSKNHIKGALASFGKSAPLLEIFSTFSSLSNSLAFAGFIKNQGILNSLNQKISSAQKSFEKKGPNAKQTAVNQVEAAINELNAQNGKGISSDGCQILTGYCQNLITKIRNAN